VSAARPSTDVELVARRDRLVERFTLMQAQLGGLYYEMAIRDHVQPHVLARKAAELQRVDIELAQVEKLLKAGDAGAAGDCPGCGSPYGRADAFCSQCGHVLQVPAEIAAS
jgi:hypothetical protein